MNYLCSKFSDETRWQSTQFCSASILLSFSGNAGYYNVTQHKVQSLSSMLIQIKKQSQQLNEKITNLSELEKTSARNFEDQESKIDGLIAKAEGHRKDLVLYAK